ncbi:hypothetical protein BJ138DRAFT_1181949 [Hygrophoropsis aurantiaca]|uniref:Uncharacterized protein n=1 Tax=Hygrophoropsis aurantiaca TaxID=72124 RepID=A0ACB8A559_9AGAM|nr:hypothetical protein BJ138DRAFT_1181949 [Hygrophoropsis aurantiaca]
MTSVPSTSKRLLSQSNSFARISSLDPATCLRCQDKLPGALFFVCLGLHLFSRSEPPDLHWGRAEARKHGSGPIAVAQRLLRRRREGKLEGPSDPDHVCNGRETRSLKIAKVHAPADSTFTTHDVWCDGLSPDILGPIDSKQTEVWDSLLESTYEWKDMFKSSVHNPAQMDIRKSSYAGAAADAGHWSWCPKL